MVATELTLNASKKPAPKGRDVRSFYMYKTPVVDVATWLVTNFVMDDWLVVKSDTEGAEFALIQKLMAMGKLCLVDVLAWQCHSHSGDCVQLKKDMKIACPRMRLIEEAEPPNTGPYSVIDSATYRDLAQEGLKLEYQNGLLWKSSKTPKRQHGSSQQQG